MTNLARGNSRRLAQQQAVAEAVARGINQKRAAALAGVSEATFYRWRADDPAFVEAIEQARGQWQSYLLDALRAAIEAAARLPGNVRAVMFALERSFPEEWGPPTQALTVSAEQANSDLDQFVQHITGVSPPTSKEH